MINGMNLVAGKWEHNKNAELFQTVNPKTNKPLPVEFQQATTDQINSAVAALSESFVFGT